MVTANADLVRSDLYPPASRLTQVFSYAKSQLSMSTFTQPKGKRYCSLSFNGYTFTKLHDSVLQKTLMAVKVTARLQLF